MNTAAGDLSLALGTFVEEANELLADMERILLRAEEAGTEPEDLNALFRCAHTIKGSGGLFGLDDVVRFTHVVESALDRLRNGSLALDAGLVALLLECQSHIGDLIGAIGEPSKVSAERGDALLDRLQTLLGSPEPDSGKTNTQLAHPEACVTASGGGPLGADHWHLSLRFSAGVLQDGMDPLAFINYLSQYGQLVHVETVADGVPEFDDADPEICYLGFEASLRSEASKEEIESVFEFVRENSNIVILPPQSRIEEFLSLIDALPEDKVRLGDILVACGTVTARELAEALDAQHRHEADRLRLGEILVDRGVVQPSLVEAAADKQRRIEEKKAVEARTVKVPAERLDALIDRIGELVIAGAGINSQTSQIGKPELEESAALLLSLVEDIRDMALRLRMVAIGEVFARFPRVVRDVSRELGKDVELRISGAEAELDKSMVDKVADPLMHLVRNALDHGIEPASARLAAGKPAKGTVSLNAYHESGSIIVEVADDGGGLDRERILRKAVERGLTSPDAKLSDSEIFNFVLAPGFSTAEKVTNLSGRGVGMDVVRSNVEALRGSLDIESTQGRGTTMRMCLPLTLAIIDGFHVGVGVANFIVPLEMVVECIELPPGLDEVSFLELRGEPLPFIRLRELFGETGSAHTRPRVIVVSFGGRKAGLVVDRIFGKCQTVIKPLGPLFSQVPSVSGSTIIGNGEVGMILDVQALVQDATRSARTAKGAPS